MKLQKIFALGLAAGLLSAAGAQASTALAEYSQVGGAPLIVWTHGTGSSTVATTALSAGQTFNTFFTFQNPSLASVVNVDSLFTLTGMTSTAANITGSNVDQPGISGTFSFLYEGSTPLVVGSHTYAAGTNLLSGTFSGADLTGQAFGSTGGLQDSIFGGGSVMFTSGIAADTLQFAPGGDEGLSLAFNALNHGLNAAPGSTLNSFNATTTGTFAADLSVGGGGGVPEPAAWALMLIGVAGIGTMLRRRVGAAA